MTQRKYLTHVSVLTLALSGTALYAYWATLAMAQNLRTQEAQLKDRGRVHIEADTVDYDTLSHVLSATGQVHVGYQDNRVLADRITYDEISDRLSAAGNIHALDGKGNLLQAETLDLTDRLTKGKLTEIRARLNDRSRIVAREAERTSADVTIYKDVQYTPCEPCTNKTRTSELWSASAGEIIQDKQKHMMTYRDMKVRVLGLPVFYSPYFSHPDSTVKRKSGWLAPTSAISKNLGAYAAVPYYWSIAPNRDLTLTPHLSSKLGLVLGGEFRHWTEKGRYEIKGSLTRDTLTTDSSSPLTSTGRKVRWHLFGHGDFDVNPTLKLGVDVQRVSDQTYLKRFRFFDLWNKASLTSAVYLEHLEPRTYALVGGYAYQGLHEAYDPDKVPTILPDARYEKKTDPNSLWGGTGTLNLQFMNLTRTTGAETQRFVMQGLWDKPYTFKNGMVSNLTLHLRQDIYNVQNYDPTDADYFNPLNTSGTTGLINGVTTRFFPQASWAWRYPWIRHFKDASLTLQPMVTVVVAPNLIPKLNIPNEDSRLFELDESNVMSANRLAGLDVLDTGSRVTVGGQADVVANAMQASLFLGQSIVQSRNIALGAESGIDTRRSDYLARLNVAYSTGLKTMVRLRLDEKTLGLKSTDIAMRLGPKSLQLQTHYFYLNPNVATGTTGSREQVTVGLRSAVTDQLSFYGSTTQDLGASNHLLQFALGATFQNECLSLTTEVYRSLLRDRDVKPDIGLRFKLVLKNFGQSSASDSENWSMLMPPPRDATMSRAQGGGSMGTLGTPSGFTSGQDLAPARAH